MGRHSTLSKHIQMTIVLAVCSMLGISQPRAANDYQQIRLLFNTISTINKYYIRKVPADRLIQGAVKGMIRSLDPGCSYISPAMMEELHKETEFAGVGVEITLRDGVLAVVAPIQGAPAANAGIKPGDKIIKIDGEPTKGITLLEAIKKLRGAKDTVLTFTVLRDSFPKPKDIPMIREPIKIQPLRMVYLDEGYAYVRISHFAEGIDQHLKAAVKSYGGAKSIKGMIIDLRNNPGGIIQQGVKTANLFLKDGLILSIKGRVESVQKDYDVTEAETKFDFKIAVLINIGTAGASEILAGALQDYDRALIFGQKSFGQGTIQSIIPLGDGSGIRLTTAEFLTPKGNPIDKKGITPDVVVESRSNLSIAKNIKNPNLNEDSVLKQAFDWLKSEKSVTELKKMKMK